MDFNVSAADNYFDHAEAQAEAACARAAEAHGVLERAKHCEDGELACPRCPWKISDR
jgi:hypothetical protein